MADAGPLGSRFTMKSFTIPASGSTRLTLKPTGATGSPASGAMPPNSAMKASPSWPNSALREKSNPFDEECTPR